MLAVCYLGLDSSLTTFGLRRRHSNANIQILCTYIGNSIYSRYPSRWPTTGLLRYWISSNLRGIGSLQSGEYIFSSSHHNWTELSVWPLIFSSYIHLNVGMPWCSPWCPCTNPRRSIYDCVPSEFIAIGSLYPPEEVENIRETSREIITIEPGLYCIS